MSKAIEQETKWEYKPVTGLEDEQWFAVTDQKGQEMAITRDEHTAALICHTANSDQELLEACKAARAFLLKPVDEVTVEETDSLYDQLKTAIDKATAGAE